MASHTVRSVPRSTIGASDGGDIGVEETSTRARSQRDDRSPLRVTPAAVPAPRPAAVARAAGCKVGVSWNNYQEERWAKWDEPAIKEVVEAGGRLVRRHRRRFVRREAGDRRREPDHRWREGHDHPGPGRHGDPAVRRRPRSTEGIPVIAYDRLIENAKAFYIDLRQPARRRADGRRRSSRSCRRATT